MSQLPKSTICPFQCVTCVDAWETHLIDSRDPGPILHGMLSLDLLKLEGESGEGVGLALLFLQLRLNNTGRLHRLPLEHGRLPAAGSPTLGLECQNQEGDRKTLDQWALSYSPQVPAVIVVDETHT